MIRQLRRKFVCIMMLFITVILVAIFSLLCYNSWHQMQQEVEQTLSIALKEEKRPALNLHEPPSPNYTMIPSFTAIVDEDGRLLQITSNQYEVSVEDVQSLIDELTDTDEGIVRSQFAYRCESDGQGGMRIAFADIFTVRSKTISECVQALFILIAALGAFFVMSIVLSAWALRPVQNAWDKQRQFIADASHELKTPLTVILADSDILLQQSNFEESKYWLHAIKNESLRMKQLVEEMLFLARNDAWRQEHTNEICALSEIAWSCALPFEAIAYEHAQTFTYEIEEQLFTKGDPAQLKQLMMIFLDNAVKYTPPQGTITFSLAQNASLISLRIQNSGSYLSKEERAHIFDRFYRCDKSRSKQQGYGLGLAIADQIAKQHRIRITVDSDHAQGTCFTLFFESCKGVVSMSRES